MGYTHQWHKNKPETSLLIFQEGQKTFEDIVENDPDNAKPFAMIMLHQLMGKAMKDVDSGVITLDQG